MTPHVTVLTLAVDDLERALVFYRDGLGLSTEGIVGRQFEHGAVAFFRLAGGLTLALYPKTSLEAEAQVEAIGARTGAIAIGHNVSSREQVDDVMAQAARAGATVTDPPRSRFWGGYSGHFCDPDGHLWEIAWNPQWAASDERGGDPPQARP